MKTNSIFEYSDYKTYLLDRIEKSSNKGRGQRKLLADAIGCQTPFITHVLSGNYHFSLEQAESCARWLELSERETEFFLLLVMKQRAGTKSLDAFVSRQLSKRREAESVLKKRLAISEEITLEDQVVYYNNWYFGAIHMAVALPHLQTLEALKAHFALSRQQVLAALDFLSARKFIEKTKTGYRPLRPVMHLGKDSPLLQQHHTQWRLRAIDSFQKKNSGNLSYSGCASLSRDDFEWVRERLSSLLEEVVERVKSSKDETLAAICFDLFHV